MMLGGRVKESSFLPLSAEAELALVHYPSRKDSETADRSEYISPYVSIGKMVPSMSPTVKQQRRMDAGSESRLACLQSKTQMLRAAFHQF
jgi:hypothetical protein